MTEHYEPVKVHVASADPGVQLGAAKASPGTCRAVYQTVVLTANDPVQDILPADPDREVAYVQALDNDIVIASTKGVAGSAVNTVASAPNPDGTLVPKINTAPWPVHDSGAVFAGATTTASSSRVSVAAYYRIRQ